MLKPINTDKAPTAIGPYSQGIEANHFIFCSGQVGVDPQTGTLVEGIEEQTKQALLNLQSILEAAGTSLHNVVKTTVYLVDVNDFAVMNVEFEAVFAGHKPARATVGVAALPKGALVEIEAVATLK